jgi:hypothetical protein
MMSDHRILNAVLKRLYVIRDHIATSPRSKSYVQGAINDQLYAIEDMDEQIWKAKNVGARNPEFDGDEVGRPDDDF